MSATPDPTELKFEPFSNVIINRHEDDDEQDKVYCQETAAILYAIAYGVVEAQRHYTRIVERAHARDQERFRKLKEQTNELEEKLVELDRRLRDPNRLRPDPLGPSVPRGSREPKLVVGSWCEMGGLVVMYDIPGKIPKKTQCPKCTRDVKVTIMGMYYRHKVPA